MTMSRQTDHTEDWFTDPMPWPGCQKSAAQTYASACSSACNNLCISVTAPLTLADYPEQEDAARCSGVAGKREFTEATVPCLSRMHHVPKFGIAVSDQIGRCRGKRKRFGELLRYPLGGRMRGNIEMNHLPTCVFDNDKNLKHFESRGWYGEEIYRRDCFTMICKKRTPTLGWRFSKSNIDEIPLGATE